MEAAHLVRRKSGRYQASHPSWYRRRGNKRIHGSGPTAPAAAVTDSVGDTLRPRDLQGQYQHHQQPLEQERYQQQAFSPSIPPADASDVWLAVRLSALLMLIK
jgi:hypothetical protein